MRKVLFAAVASSIALALTPAIALAQGHHHRRDHRTHRTHAPVRDEHFGSRNDENTTPSNSAQTAVTVASFNNGVLTLMLNDGSMVSGQVTNATEIKCEAAEPQDMEHSRRADGDHGGGNNGGGDDNGGSDENGGGDDNGQGQDDQGAPMCSAANLVAGMVVREAELAVSGTGAIWREVEVVAQNQ